MDRLPIKNISTIFYSNNHGSWLLAPPLWPDSAPPPRKKLINDILFRKVLKLTLGPFWWPSSPLKILLMIFYPKNKWSWSLALPPCPPPPKKNDIFFKYYSMTTDHLKYEKITKTLGPRSVKALNPAMYTSVHLPYPFNLDIASSDLYSYLIMTVF